MNIHIRYIGDALTEWNRMNIAPSIINAPLKPEWVHLNDIISHPDFPDRWLMIRARHIDLSEPALTLYLDLLPDNQSGQNFPENVLPLFPG